MTETLVKGYETQATFSCVVRYCQSFDVQVVPVLNARRWRCGSLVTSRSLKSQNTILRTHSGSTSPRTLSPTTMRARCALLAQLSIACMRPLACDNYICQLLREVNFFKESSCMPLR